MQGSKLGFLLRQGFVHLEPHSYHSAQLIVTPSLSPLPSKLALCVATPHGLLTLSCAWQVQVSISKLVWNWFKKGNTNIEYKRKETEKKRKKGV